MLDNISTLKILIIEDEVKIAQTLRDYLVREGYEVGMLHDGTDAIELIKTNTPDFLLLDLMLPGKDGVSICREVRTFSNLPIMMITAKVDEIDRLIGLEIGADDYVCKPFMPREIIARIKSIMRRVSEFQVKPTISLTDECIRYRDIQLYPKRFECQINTQKIDLTCIQFRMLQALVEQPGRVYSRDALMGCSYEDKRIVSHRTIDSHIKNIRKKINEARTDKNELLHTIYAVGYKIE